MARITKAKKTWKPRTMGTHFGVCWMYCSLLPGAGAGAGVACAVGVGFTSCIVDDEFVEAGKGTDRGGRALQRNGSPTDDAARGGRPLYKRNRPWRRQTAEFVGRNQFLAFPSRNRAAFKLGHLVAHPGRGRAAASLARSWQCQTLRSFVVTHATGCHSLASTQLKGDGDIAALPDGPTCGSLVSGVVVIARERGV